MQPTVFSPASSPSSTSPSTSSYTTTYTYPSPPQHSPPPTASTSSTSSTSTRRKRVTAEHTLSRVRENQRRHRARRRDYIATLEERLAAAEQALATARAEIAVLRRERETGVVVLPCAHGGNGADGEGDVDVDVNREMEVDGNVEVEERRDGAGEETGMQSADELELGSTAVELQGRERQAPEMDETPTVDIDIDLAPETAAFFDVDGLPTDITTALGPPPCCTDTPSASTPTSTPSDPECSTCATRPAPLPTESTTLCAQAYAMISAQNFRDVDPGTIRLWLYQGYRRAQRQGEGCRVENGALFRLLDYISGV